MDLINPADAAYQDIKTQIAAINSAIVRYENRHISRATLLHALHTAMRKLPPHILTFQTGE